MGQGGGNQAGKKRVGAVWAGLELGVELGGDEVWMNARRQLDNLDQPVVRRNAAKNHAGSGHLLAVLVVDLVAVAVALGNRAGAVKTHGQGVLSQAAGVRPEAHGRAFVGDTFLLGQDMDDGVGGRGVHFFRIGVCQIAGVAGKLDHGHLKAVTDADKRQAGLAGVFDSGNFAFDAPAAEAGGDY